MGQGSPLVDVWSLGVVLYRTVTGTLTVVGEGFLELKQQVQKEYFHVPHLRLQNVKTFLKNNNPPPQPKKNPGIYTEGPLAQHEAGGGSLASSGPPWGHMDLQVTEIMKNLGFEWDEIRNQKQKYNTCLISVSSTERKAKGHTIRVRLHSPDPHSCILPPLGGSARRACHSRAPPGVGDGHPWPSPPAWPSTHS